ncbi:MAG: hypothetical protein K0Q72_2227 [Armatimonadetes bacterium]|jgi:hypothetical protein|nr:hypothetical protein [Armatimonadota bacterium]
MRQSREYRNGLAIAGLIAAGAMAVRAVTDFQSGWPLLLVAVAILAALALRRFVFRD